ncbi:hypothetical protein [Nocardia spumae]|uniref:hypothetical protein n=1 Tax=Nocardia spumae TaxID=2887190 RepID=UPI001D15A911|nr:hypothetical protein [Nocardia spumae]
MPEVHRTRLEWARDVARAYRGALLKVDPDMCARLDGEAHKFGQGWVAPKIIPTAVAEEAVTAAATPARIAEICGIPAGTIYSWISRGLLTPVDDSRPAKYLVRDVAGVDARRKARRLDSA